jgi:hypothetical protein
VGDLTGVVDYSTAASRGFALDLKGDSFEEQQRRGSTRSDDITAGPEERRFGATPAAACWEAPRLDISGYWG